jgi:hypothetical protein
VSPEPEAKRRIHVFDEKYFVILKSTSHKGMTIPYSKSGNTTYPCIGKGTLRNSNGEKTEVIGYKDIVKDKKSKMCFKIEIVFDKNKL